MISLWLMGGLFAAGMIAWLYVARGTANSDMVEAVIQRCSIIVMGISGCILGALLLGASATWLRILAFFIIGVGAQVTFWALGIRVELLGSVPSSDRSWERRPSHAYAHRFSGSPIWSEALVLRALMLRGLGALDGLERWERKALQCSQEDTEARCDATLTILRELSEYMISHPTLIDGEESPWGTQWRGAFDSVIMALAAAEATRRIHDVVHPLQQAYEVVNRHTDSRIMAVLRPSDA